MLRWLGWKEKKEKEEPHILDNLPPLGAGWDVAFLTVDNQDRSYTAYGSAERNAYQSYMKIQYSGKVVTLGEEDSYECLVDGKIKWIKKSFISFPKIL